MKNKLINTIFLSVGIVAGTLGTNHIHKKTMLDKDNRVYKFKSYYDVLNRWLVLKQQDKSIEDYFKENGYKNVAIYGMGEIGLRLYDELHNSSICIKYIIDQDAESIVSEVKVLNPDEKFEPVDIIIVTAMFAFDEIKNEIKSKASCPVISIEEVITSILKF